MKNKKYLPKLQMLHEHFLKYLLFGGIAAIIDLTSFALLTTITKTIFVANTGATVIGATTNYALNYKNNFNYKGTYAHNTCIRAIIAFFISISLNSTLLWIFIKILPILIAKIIVIMAMVFINFAVNRNYVFTAHRSL